MLPLGVLLRKCLPKLFHKPLGSFQIELYQLPHSLTHSLPSVILSLSFTYSLTHSLTLLPSSFSHSSPDSPPSLILSLSSLPHSSLTHPSLTPSLPHYSPSHSPLTPSPSLTHALTILPLSLLTHSLPPSLTHSLPRSLLHSLTPSLSSLTHSHSLTPSLPLSLSLAHSLIHSPSLSPHPCRERETRKMTRTELLSCMRI